MLRKVMLAGRNVALLALFLLLQPLTANSAVIYAVDDGVRDTGIGSTTAGPFIFANNFTALAGGQTITEVSIMWSVVADDTPMTAALWSDPDGDGNPLDAILVSSVLGVTANAGTNTFISYDIPDVTLAIGTSFFVGGIINQQGGDFPIAGDTTAPISNASWANPTSDWSLPATNVGVDFSTDLMIRATGVPEPATIALLGLGLAGLGFVRRKLPAT